MGYAFISYSSKDAKLAAALKKILDNNNVDNWIAPDDIPVGSKYAKVLNNALKNCSCLILILSNNSQSSTWVAKEVERAINYEKTIIPIRVEELTLNDEFEFYISTDQVIDVRDFDESNPQVQALIARARECNGASTYQKTMLSDMVVETDAPVVGAPAPDSSKKPNPSRIILIACACIVVLVAVFLVAKGCDTPADTPDTPTNDVTDTLPSGKTPEKEPEQQPEQTPEQQPEQTPEQQPEQTPEQQPEQKNQIPEQFEDDVEALKHADPLSLSVSTIRVKVGDYATPQAASVWEGATIYSQNTDIAVGEGKLVKGVSKGETYVVVKGGGSICSAYYVIVE